MKERKKEKKKERKEKKRKEKKSKEKKRNVNQITTAFVKCLFLLQNLSL